MAGKKTIQILILAGFSFVFLAVAHAGTASFPLAEITARFAGLRQEAVSGVVLAGEQEKRAARLAELARKRGQAQAEAVANQALRAAAAARQRHLANKAKAEQALLELARYQGREAELTRARKRLNTLRDDVAAIQFALKLYRDASLRNSAEFDAQAEEITRRSNKILADGISYLADVATGKLLKDVLKRANRDQAKNIEDFAELLNQAKTEKDVVKWLADLAERKSELIDGANILAGALVPGWEHVKMNAEAWAAVGRECLAWQEINRLDRETGQYADEVARLGRRLKIKMEEITCLKRCMPKKLIGCTAECGARGIGFAVPPP